MPTVFEKSVAPAVLHGRRVVAAKFNLLHAALSCAFTSCSSVTVTNRIQPSYL